MPIQIPNFTLSVLTGANTKYHPLHSQSGLVPIPVSIPIPNFTLSVLTGADTIPNFTLSVLTGANTNT